MQIFGSFGGKKINNGNRTEWSPIRSVIVQVINKIGRPRSRSVLSNYTGMTRTVQLHFRMNSKIRLVDNQSDSRICYSFD